MSGTLIVLTGPTGVGKTELSLQLAERYACPIVSADSRQFYGDIPIGTAAPTIEQLSRVEHYFVGQLALSDYYSASCYEEDVLKLLDKLFKTNDYVLLTGGSMLYIDAVCKGIDEIPTITDEIRREVAAHYEKVGLAALCEELKVLDIEVNRLVALRRVVRHEFVSFTEERACVVQSCQRIAFFEKQHLRILGARFSFADFVVDIRYEAHDHRLAAFAALHGHDGLRRPTPSACGEQLAELCT